MTSDLATNEPGVRLTRTELRTLIGQMCDMWERLLTVDDSNNYRLDVLDLNRVIGIRAHAHHAARTARAILALDETTTGIELVPLSRLVFECGVTAAWLLVTPMSGHTLLLDGVKKRKFVLDQLRDRGRPTSPGREQTAETLRKLEETQFPTAFQFEQRCRALRGGDEVYVLYRAQSALAHAGLSLADHYIIESPQSPIGVAFDADAPDTIREAELGITASMLLLALNANETALASAHRTTQIARFAKKLHVGTRIVRADGYETPPRA